MTRTDKLVSILWLLVVSPALIIFMVLLFLWLQINYWILRPLGYRLKDWEGSEIPQAAVEMAHGIFPGHSWEHDPSVVHGWKCPPGLEQEWCRGCHGWRRKR